MAVTLCSRSLGLPAAGLRVRLGLWPDVFLAGGMVGVGLAVRWPNLTLSPQFPSVGATILLALDVLDGRALPLVDQAPYLGPLFVYLLALTYAAFGPSVESTMLLPWAIGGSTVVPVYLLGRELGGRLAAVVAAGLVVTSGGHTVVTSHVPLSHSLTPLFAIATLWLLARAVRRHEGKALALAGLSAGLSLHTHPTVAPLLLGAGAAALASRPAWLRSRWTYAAIGLAVIAYSPLLVHHVQSRFEVVADIEAKHARYLDADDAGEDSSDEVYTNNLQQLTLSVAQLASGAIEEREEARDYLGDPAVLVYPLLGVIGLVGAARTGQPFLLVGLAAAVFVPPALSGKYKPILDGRYVMPMVPLLWVGLGVSLSAAARLAARLAPGRAGAALAGLAVAALALALVVHPLGALGEFYEESLEDGFSNARYLRTLRDVQAAWAGGEPVLLDPRLNEIKSAGGGNAGRNLTWLFAISRIPTETLTGYETPSTLSGRIVVLHRSTVRGFEERLELAPLDGRRSDSAEPEAYRAYRVAGPRGRS